ncbi:hypothetical protein BC830DRAFT_15149 [Chytriomyces sp. MP71]|nr:hypothetical protein BC830DRAFT_15149 [Chytriomyces sp. MP71]
MIVAASQPICVFKTKMRLSELRDSLVISDPQLRVVTVTAADGIRKERIFAAAASTLRHSFQVASMKYGQRIAYILNGKPTTFSEQEAAVIRFAHALSLIAKVAKGDRVAICLRNCPEWMFAFWATVCVGGIAVAINSTLHPKEMAFCLTDSDPRVVVVDAERATSLASFITKSKNITWIATADDDLCKAGSGRETLPEVDVNGGDDATILYTSGTTGKPKGVLCTHRNYTQAMHQSIFTKKFYQKLLGLACVSSTDFKQTKTFHQRTALHVAPLFHTMGLLSTLLFTSSGVKSIFLPKWNSLQALKLIQEHSINLMTGVPTMYNQILNHPEFLNYDISSLDGLSTGAAPASTEMLQKVTTVSRANLTNGYGLTETTSVCCRIAKPLLLNKPSSVGPPTATVEVAILQRNQSGEPTSFAQDFVRAVQNIGDVGEIAIRGPNVFKGYWRQMEATSRTLSKDGWFLSGDIGRLDEDGCLYILDRSKDMIIRGGENVYAVEVENVICKFSGISECAVIGIPDATLGETVCAVVILQPNQSNFSSKSLIAFCQSQLALYKCPVEISVWDDKELPKNAAGKVLKGVLKNQLKHSKL